MSSLSVGRYLFERLKQLGVKSVFGVPGDYELILLDMVPEAGLEWRGNPNELNASYAADGYGRINGVGACITTFGPGELSASCGIAGSYTESVPVVSIVGYPPASAMKNHLILHHSLGDGQFGMFHEMVKNITVATTIIDKTAGAAAEIDRVLNAMLFYSKPVYIGLAVDVAPLPIPASTLLQTPLITELDPNDPTLQSEVVGKIANAIRTLPKTMIIVDGLAIRNRLVSETKALIKAANVPYFTTAMAKGFDETLPKFGGVYGGFASPKELREAAESADCVLWVGSYSSDFNTGEFTERVRPDTVVDFQRHFVQLRGKRYPLKMKHTLVALAEALEENRGGDTSTNTVSWDPYPMDHPEKPPKLTQDYLWPTIGRYLRTGDLVLAETGTSAYGIPGANLTSQADFTPIISQTVFGSIGFASGCAVGAFVAGREANTMKRPILITGEGSLQLTVQAFSDLLRHSLGATVFLLNNGGYTVERLIHGPHASYNAVPVWDYSMLGALFAPQASQAGKFKHYAVRTPDELEKLLGEEQFAVRNPRDGVTQVVELFLDMLDAPSSVKNVTAAIDEFNATTATAGK